MAYAYPFSSLPAYCTHWKNFSEHNAHNDYGFTTSQDKMALTATCMDQSEQ